jgi:hypothetical protein
MSMTLITTVTVGSGGISEFQIGSFPSTYTDLLLLVSIRHSGSAVEDMYLKFNGAGSGYSGKVLFGTGTAVSSVNMSTSLITSVGVPGSAATSNTFYNASIYIPNYSGSTNKPVSIEGVGENNGTAANQSITAALRSSTEAITFLQVGAFNQNLVQHSSISVYGITKGSGGATVS